MGVNMFGAPSTFDTHNQYQTVPYVDPALLSKCPTTHDLSVAALTVEHPPGEVGALQVLGDETYRFNGTEWMLCP